MSFHLKRSNTLPDVMDYHTAGIGNPIMNCLADQTKDDLEWKHYHFTAETLLEIILTNLENGHLFWRPGSINKNEWIQKTRQNPNWYLINKNGLIDSGAVFDGDNLLLSLASNYLKRKIQLIPIFEKGFKMFGNESSSNPYRLMSCQDTGRYNFFLSVW